jgi:biotin carboxyl carrier protein
MRTQQLLDLIRRHGLVKIESLELITGVHAQLLGLFLVLTKVGVTVKAGDPLQVAEAMKMETDIQAPITGTVNAIHVVMGDSVNPDETLVEIG